MDTKYSMYMYSTCIYITSYETIRGIVGMSRPMCAPSGGFFHLPLHITNTTCDLYLRNALHSLTKHATTVQVLASLACEDGLEDEHRSCQMKIVTLDMTDA
jgi:hypothetical protein